MLTLDVTGALIEFYFGGREVVKKIKRIRRTFQQKPRGWSMSCLQRPFVLPKRIVLLHHT